MSGVTQKSIAQHLGISRPLVAHALAGRPGVAEETRLRVLAAARQLGYSIHSNREARALIARRYERCVRHNLIAVFTDSYATGGPMRNAPYFGPIFGGVEQEANESDLDVLFCAYRRSAHRLPRFLLNREVDGIISVNAPTELAQQVRELGLPLVSVGVRLAEADVSLVPDDAAGMTAAVKHLTALGHRHIAYLSPRSYTLTVADRLEAFRDAVTVAGVAACDDGLVEASAPSVDATDAEAGMDALLARRPDLSAVVCYNDTMAMGAVRRLQALGRRVPEDVSVVGFDDTSVQYGFTPALTSVSSPRADMGRAAVRTLTALTAAREAAAPSAEMADEGEGKGEIEKAGVARRVRAFPVDLVLRDTTALADSAD